MGSPPPPPSGARRSAGPPPGSPPGRSPGSSEIVRTRLPLPSKRVYVEGGKVDLERLALSSGQARSLDLEVGLDPIELGGQTYSPAGGADARLDVSRTSSGYALRLRFEGELSGPCVRCLEPAANAVEVDAREVDHPAAN